MGSSDSSGVCHPEQSSRRNLIRFSVRRLRLMAADDPAKTEVWEELLGDTAVLTGRVALTTCPDPDS
jgi:hypothetical protein